MKITRPTECERCGTAGVPLTWEYVHLGRDASAVCADKRDCERAQLEKRVETAQCEDALEELAERDRVWSESAAMFASDDVAWEVSTEHDALQGVIPLDGDVTQGALL